MLREQTRPAHVDKRALLYVASETRQSAEVAATFEVCVPLACVAGVDDE